MHIVHDISEARSWVKEQLKKEASIGFVPTMGALHKGHISLINRSLGDNENTIVSVFVNKTQFNDSKDFDKYPRPFETDIELLKDIGCDMVFNPDSTEIYKDIPQIRFSFDYLDNRMEGLQRPGHFSGVALIVSKLFNIIQPTSAYFGQKDLQQCAVVKKMVDDLNYDLKIVTCPTIREDDGLAFSSRNALLSVAHRIEASKLNYSLVLAIRKLKASADVNQTIQEAKTYYDAQEEIDLEYFEIVNSKTMEPVSKIDKLDPISVCLAAKIGNVRLIDNMYVNQTNI